MNRIDAKFNELRERNEPAFIPFITAGDPSLDATRKLIVEFDRKGSDMIELGVPYSDPIADGPVIQSSYYRALSGGVKLSNILELVKDVRKKSEIPIVSMISQSILLRMVARILLKAQLKQDLMAPQSLTFLLKRLKK